jgi:hypothetical protein
VGVDALAYLAHSKLQVKYCFGEIPGLKQLLNDVVMEQCSGNANTTPGCIVNLQTGA